MKLIRVGSYWFNMARVLDIEFAKNKDGNATARVRFEHGITHTLDRWDDVRSLNELLHQTEDELVESGSIRG